MSPRLAPRDNPLLKALIEQARKQHEAERRQARIDASVAALVVFVYAILAITGWHP